MNTNNRLSLPGKLSPVFAAILTAGALLAPTMGHAQSAIVGGLGNFDAANFEGQDVHGLEIQIEGIQPGDLLPSWCGNKYGCPVVTASATGVYVRYQSQLDPVTGQFLATTVPHAASTPFGGTCYMINPTTYAAAGCDHFGVHINYTAAGRAITAGYRWLLADPANPGQLIASTHNMFVPTPVYSWGIPATPAAPPVLIVEIQTPPPPPPPPALPPQFGDATWMKVYKTELNREVALEELTADNAIVPQDPTQIETDWVLMQPAPPPDGRHRQRNRHVNSGGVNSGTRSVIRRYETYAFTGTYDPLTHEVVCGGDGTCNAPQPGELGDMLNAQMAAANVAVPGVTVTKVGTGDVSSADKVIACGNKCSASYALNTVVNLTAKPASNFAFSGWTGACAGAALTCAVTVSDVMNVTATFTASAGGGGGGGGGTSTGSLFTVSIGRSNPGTVTGDLTGINCGNACSAKYASGTLLTLTATPPLGKSFVGWGGACSGTSAVCALTVNANSSVQANFGK